MSAKPKVVKVNVMPIKLELNGELTKEITIEFSDLPQALSINLLELFTITILNVPVEVEYELSKLIFNRVTIAELKEDNKTYTAQIANHLSYNEPK